MIEENIITIYWYYRLRMDTLKNMIKAQAICNNELRNVSGIHDKTVEKFNDKIVDSHLIIRFETAIFSALQRRLDYYEINSRKYEKGKNRKVKKIYDSEKEVITSWKEAKDYLERKQVKIKIARGIFEIVYGSEINLAGREYSREDILMNKLNKLHQELKDQPIPKEYLEDIRKAYLQMRHWFGNIEF